MKTQDDRINAQVESAPQPDQADQPETLDRRELIARYSKYAAVAAPLVLFASKAHAIHSAP